MWLGIAGLLSATIVAFIIGVYLSNLPRYYRVNENGVQTQATVISKESHGYISVEYNVNNRKFKSGGHARDIDKNFEEVQLNDKVSVYYDPLAPEDSTLGNPNKHLKASFVEIGFITIIPILLFVFYVIKLIANSKTKKIT